MELKKLAEAETSEDTKKKLLFLAEAVLTKKFNLDLKTFITVSVNRKKFLSKKKLKNNQAIRQEQADRNRYNYNNYSSNYRFNIKDSNQK